MINVLQKLKKIQTKLKNLHKEKNVKTKNVVFIKKEFKNQLDFINSHVSGLIAPSPYFCCNLEAN